VVAKLFDPRAEFVTAWQLKGRIQCDLRDRQQPVLSHCCPQPETRCLKKCSRYLAGCSLVTPGLSCRNISIFLAPPTSV